jgi:hypothetical protein
VVTTDSMGRRAAPATGATSARETRLCAAAATPPQQGVDACTHWPSRRPWPKGHSRAIPECARPPRFRLLRHARQLVAESNDVKERLLMRRLP